MAERTGCPVLSNLWSYVIDNILICHYNLCGRTIVEIDREARQSQWSTVDTAEVFLISTTSSQEPAQQLLPQVR